MNGLMEAGLMTLWLVSTVRERRSDELTGAPGTRKKTVAGIDNALKAGLGITLNIVLTTRNIDHLNEAVEFALKRFPKLEGIILSPLQPHGSLLNHPELMPPTDGRSRPNCGEDHQEAGVLI